jgi:hypothetical protein
MLRSPYYKMMDDWGKAQVVEDLHYKREALSSIPTIAGKKKKV